MDNNNLMNGDFEADFFSPLPQEEPEGSTKKKDKKSNKKLIFGIVGVVAAVAVATVVILLVSAGSKTPKERFIRGMEALMDELQNPGPSWQEEVDYEAIEASMYTDAMSADIELNLTVPEQLTVGVDILHDSDYPAKRSNTNVEVSVFNIPLIEANITLDEDMWYFSLPDLVDEIYSIDGATLGKDFNASEWTYQLGLYVAESYVWEGFTGPVYSEAVNEEFNEMLSEGIEKVKENMVVEEEEKPAVNGKISGDEYLNVVLKKEDVNELMEDIMAFLGDSGLADTQQMYFPELADDINLLVALDKKDRIVAISGQNPLTFEEESMGEWEYGFAFFGKENVTDRVVATVSICLDGAKATAVVEYDKSEEDDVCENELSMILSADDGVGAYVMEMSYQREWDQKEKKFKDAMEITIDDETVAFEMKGSIEDIVAGEQFTMDLNRLAIYAGDTELFKVTGEISVAPFEGEIDVPDKSIDVFALSEAEMEELLTDVVEAIYAKVLGE